MHKHNAYNSNLKMAIQLTLKLHNAHRDCLPIGIYVNLYVILNDFYHTTVTFLTFCSHSI